MECASFEWPFSTNLPSNLCKFRLAERASRLSRSKGWKKVVKIGRGRLRDLDLICTMRGVR